MNKRMQTAMAKRHASHSPGDSLTGLRVTQLIWQQPQVVLKVDSTSPTATCPVCHPPLYTSYWHEVL